MKEFHKKYGNYIHKARMAPFELARMLAKIAHGFAVVDFGVDGFDHLAGNIDTILNKTQDVGYSVGGVKYDLEPILDRDHSIRHVMIQRGPFDIGKIIVPIVYEIRLFCQIKGFPAYYVLVGHLNLNKKEHKITFQNKLDMIKDSKLETIVL